MYPHLEDDHTPDLMSAMQTLSRDQHPFPVEHMRRVNMMMAYREATVSSVEKIARLCAQMGTSVPTASA